jgi:hypothetical protein
MQGQKQVSLWDLADLTTPWCVHVAATLRIAEHIQAGTTDIGGLASAAGCDAAVLHQVLGHLVGKGLFEEPSPGQFALNEPARELLHPITRSSLDLEDIGGRFAQAWGTLLQYVRSGEPAYAQVFGLGFWEDLDAHPQIAASFDAIIGPPGHGTPSPDFQISGGWGAVRTVVDVGGGTGAMLAEILRAQPHTRGILVERPATAARSAEIFQAAGVSDRASTSGQSFFDPLPPGADLYLLRGILNDYPDRQALAILLRCAQAARKGSSERNYRSARPNGRVVVLKSVGPDDTPKDISIEGILLGGRHRGLTEFTALAHQAGLEVTTAAQQPEYYVVECKPV